MHDAGDDDDADEEEEAARDGGEGKETEPNANKS